MPAERTLLRKLCGSEAIRAGTAAGFAAALSACVAQYAPTVRPLSSDESGLVVQLRPLPPELDRLAFDVQSVTATRFDGGEAPLTVALPHVARARGERRLAWGRVPPGTYSGIAIRVRRATTGGAELRVPPDPLRADMPFEAKASAATVLSVQLATSQLLQAGTFAPGARASIPVRTVPPLAGFTSDSGALELTEFDRRARNVTAVLPTGGAPWGLALDEIQGRLYAAIADGDRIDVFDVSSGGWIGSIRLNLGDRPREIALTPDRRLLVSANSGSNSASFLDPLSLIEVGRVKTGDQPTALLMDRNGRRAYVFNFGASNDVTVLDVGNRTVAATVTTGLQPLRGQLNRAGTRLYVPHGGTAFVDVLSLPDLTVSGRLYVGLGTSAIKVDSNTDLIYVANRTSTRLSVFDPFSLIPVDSVELPAAGATYFVIDNAENAMFALFPEQRLIATFDLTTRRQLSSFETGDGPRVVALMGERL